jgi:hypothetical protein
MKTAHHSVHSPDLAPSEFYLFGYVKGCLAVFPFESIDELPKVVRGVVDGIEKGTLQAVFLEWMDRLRKCTAANGGHTD